MEETLQTLSHAHFELETVIEFVKFNIYIFSCSSRNPMIIQIITNNNTAKSILMPHSLIR